jgi:hypothetical protein
MSELQIGLLAIGALVIGGVLAYNRIQERRAREAARRAFPPAGADVLMGSEAAPGRAPAAATPARSEPHGAGPVALDERLDYVMEVRPRGAVSAASVQEHWRPIQRRHAPRATLSGPGADGVWRTGLQLVSRDGMVG